MVTQIPVPPEARERSTLDRIDYADAFVVDTTGDHTAEEWARAVLEDAPATTRASLRSGWTSLGLKLDHLGSAPNVLGWRIRRNAADHVLLEARGRLGLSGELLFERRDGELRFSTFVRLSHVAARGLWAAIEPTHVRVVRELLGRALR
jgi:hypothetical protein